MNFQQRHDSMTAHTGFGESLPLEVLRLGLVGYQEALDVHHASPMMQTLAEMREKYDLRMVAERYVSAEGPESDEQFLRK